jgi:hypothetical protein
MRIGLKVAVISLMMTGAVVTPTLAENTMPSGVDQEVLIKSSLLTLNDANLTGNYAVLHDKLSKPFRDQFSADKLKNIFKDFADKHIDIAVVAAKPVTPGGAEKIDEDGVLKLEGTIVVSDTRTVSYNLKFIPSEGEWKLVGLDVKQ